MTTSELLGELLNSATSHRHDIMPHPTMPYTTTCFTCSRIKDLIQQLGGRVQTEEARGGGGHEDACREGMIEIDLDAEDELRQGVIGAALEFCHSTRKHRDNLVACAPSWGVDLPGHFMALHASMDALLKFKQESTLESDSTASTTHDNPKSDKLTSCPTDLD